MKLTLQLRLLPSQEQAVWLLATMERVNEAATFAAQKGFEAGVFSQPSIHKLSYSEIRSRFKLSAQMAVLSLTPSALASPAFPAVTEQSSAVALGAETRRPTFLSTATRTCQAPVLHLEITGKLSEAAKSKY